MSNIVNSNYAPFHNEDGLELVINTETGECFASQSALARMVDVSEAAIRKWVKNPSNQIEVFEAQIQTTQGLRTSNLINEDGIYQAFCKYKPELLIACAKAGIRMYLHTLAGYKFQKVEQDEIIEIHQEPERVLPSRDAVDYANAATQIQTLPNGILKQLIKDALIDQIETERNLKYLPVAEKPKKYTIAKVRAKQLGYSDRQIGNGIGLGRFVRSRVEPSFQEYVGRYPVYHYEINQELDQAIAEYFS